MELEIMYDTYGCPVNSQRQGICSKVMDYTLLWKLSKVVEA